MAVCYTRIESPVGPLVLVASDAGLHHVLFAKSTRTKGEPEWRESAELVKEVIKQLRAYFAKELEVFELMLAPEGTKFQQSVWSELCGIPYGETISYGELAKRVGNPKASRAVGAANGQNPLPIIVPCHRVIGANGSLVGYGGGIDTKRWLLNHEQGRVGLFA